MESYRHVINDAAARGYQNMMTAVSHRLGSQPVCSLPGLQRIDIAAEFVLQLSKPSSIQYRSSLTKRNGPGGGI